MPLHVAKIRAVRPRGCGSNLGRRKRLYLYQSVRTDTGFQKVSYSFGTGYSFLEINPSAWGHLNPSSYCNVGRLFYGVFKLWSKLQREKNEEIISMNSLPHNKRASSFTNKREAA